MTKRLLKLKDHYTGKEYNTLLPKQFFHWLAKAGIKPDVYSSRMFRPKRGVGSFYYFTGNGRFYRINCEAKFEVSVSKYLFDRWANSNVGGIDLSELIVNEAQTVSRLKALLIHARSQEEDGRFDARKGIEGFVNKFNF